MDYEKKYETALEKAKGIINYYKSRNRNEAAIEDLQEIFPELKESEDEKIKKELIDAVQGLWDNDALPMPLSEKRKDAWIVYLEKQGEKDKLIKELGEYKVKYTQEILSQQLEKQGIKPQGKSALEAAKEKKVANTNKVEPKFKNGQWIVWQDKCYKVNYNGCGYELIDQNGISASLEYGAVDESAHLWSIEDAHEGDVLYSPCLRLLWIFKSRDTVYCGCNLNYNNGAICGEGYFERPTDAIPATKEQVILFFQKMKEAGCRWNSTEKKLEKIDSGKESESKKEERTYSTEECNCIIQDTISICEQARKKATNEIDYENATRCIGWLKILKYRHTWKPSKEQMNTLLFISSVLQDKQVIVNLEELNSLYNDLKKL